MKATDFWDVSDSTIKSISNKNLLLLEYQHVNKVIAEQRASETIAVSRLSTIAFSFYSLVFSFLFYEYKQDNILPPEYLFYTLLYSVFFFTVIFCFLIIAFFCFRLKPIKRKQLLIEQINNF